MNYLSEGVLNKRPTDLNEKFRKPTQGQVSGAVLEVSIRFRFSNRGGKL